MTISDSGSPLNKTFSNILSLCLEMWLPLLSRGIQAYLVYCVTPSNYGLYVWSLLIPMVSQNSLEVGRVLLKESCL
jgi:hypothetical protein